MFSFRFSSPVVKTQPIRSKVSFSKTSPVALFPRVSATGISTMFQKMNFSSSKNQKNQNENIETTTTTNASDAAVAAANLEEQIALSGAVPVDAVNRKFAIVALSGKQYKVTNGDYIITQKLEAPVGESILLKKILLVGGKKFTAIGRPLVSSAAVLATVEEQAKTAKQIIFKQKLRKNYRRWKGVRHPITVLRIDDVIYNETEAVTADQVVNERVLSVE